MRKQRVKALIATIRRGEMKKEEIERRLDEILAQEVAKKLRKRLQMRRLSRE